MSGCCVAIHNSQTYGTGIYRHMRCTAYKVAPDDGLIQSETCRASNEKIKCNHKNFVHLVVSYTYCRMMRDAYNVKLLTSLTVHMTYCMCKLTDTFDNTSVRFTCKLLMC